MTRKTMWTIVGLLIICVLGLAYDAWVIIAGHPENLSLYAPACGIFAGMIWWLDRFSPEERESFLKAAHEGSAFSDEAVKRRVEHYSKRYPLG